MKQLILPDGHVAVVDDSDYDRVKDFPWRLQPKKGYVIATVYLHRIVMQAPSGLTVDHGDRNKLNCQKSNLELVPLTENLRRRWVCPRSGASKYRGVCRGKRGRWRAIYKRKYIGSFSTEEAAAAAYADAVFNDR